MAVHRSPIGIIGESGWLCKNENTPRMEIAVLIVGFHNSEDISDCLWALSKSSPEPPFDIFICENGGLQSFSQLLEVLLGDTGPCEEVKEHEIAKREWRRCKEVRR